MNCRFTSLDYYQNGGRYTLNASIPLLNVLPANNMTNWSELFYDWNQRRWRGNIRANVTGNIESIEVYLNFDFNGWIIDGTIYPKNVDRRQLKDLSCFRTVEVDLLLKIRLSTYKFRSERNDLLKN